MKKRNRILIIVVLTGLSFLVVALTGLGNSGKGALFVIHDRNDLYMDWFHTLVASCDTNAFSQDKNVYPPFFLGIIRLATNCDRLGGDAFAARDQNIILTTIACVALVIFGYIGAGLIGSRLGASAHARIIAGITVASWPPLIFGLDRLNTIILAYVLLLTALYASTFIDVKARECNPLLLGAYDVGLSLILASIKPYMAAPCLAWMLIRSDIKPKLRILEVFAFIAVFVCLNQLYFTLGFYDGSIWTWKDALTDFRAITDASLSHIWNMNYYSVSLLGNAEVGAIAGNHEEFVDKFTGNGRLGLITFAILMGAQIFTSVHLLYCSVRIVRPSDDVSTHEERQRRQGDAYRSYRPSFELPYQTARLAFLCLVFAAMSIFSPKWGLYSAVIWLPPIVVAIFTCTTTQRKTLFGAAVLYYCLSAFQSRALVAGIAPILTAYFVIIYAASQLAFRTQLGPVSHRIDQQNSFYSD